MIDEEVLARREFWRSVLFDFAHQNQMSPRLGVYLAIDMAKSASARAIEAYHSAFGRDPGAGM